MAEYIEREAVLWAMSDYFHKTDPDGEEQIGVLKMHRLVRKHPAADVAPVVHGRWKQGAYHFYCSECFVECRDKVPYCPNCGARMDGE